MDANKIFGLFTGDHSSEQPSERETVTLENYTEHPVYWVGMFKKLIHNHKNFNHKVKDFLTNLNQELDIYDVETAGEFVVYNRAWYWIEQIDITIIDHQNAIAYHTDDYLSTYIQFAISYWEEYEEYEKCAHLKKIYDLVKEFSI